MELNIICEDYKIRNFKKENGVAVLDSNDIKDNLTIFLTSFGKILCAHQGFPFTPIKVRDFGILSTDLKITSDIHSGHVIEKSISVCLFNEKTRNIDCLGLAAIRWNSSVFLVKKDIWHAGIKDNKIEGIKFDPLKQILLKEASAFNARFGTKIDPIKRMPAQKIPKLKAKEVFVTEYNPLKSIGTGVNEDGQTVLLELFNFHQSMKIPNLQSGTIIRCGKLEKFPPTEKYSYRGLDIGIEEKRRFPIRRNP